MAASFIRRRIAVILLFLTIVIWVSIADDNHQQQINSDTYYFDGVGGERATFTNATPFWDETYESFPNYRRDVCERYELVRKGEWDLQDALRGLELSTVFFQEEIVIDYSEKDGINPDYPGLGAHILDLIAERAGFTWRNSFAFVEASTNYGMTFDQMLWWSVNTFDIAGNWWDHALDRLEMGVAFTAPWYDASLILVDEITADEITKWEIDVLWNWTRPFQVSVWILIFMTVIVSGLVYQLIENIQGERQDRPFSQWFMDNFYLSVLNATTNFDYSPSTAAGRIFAVSMATFSLIISATYTANLANLFVDQTRVNPRINSIEEAVTQKIPICTLRDSNSDQIIRERYYTAERRPQPTESAMFAAFRAGECNLMAMSRDGWRIYRGQLQYNPDCRLAPVGRIVAEVNSGFAVKPDVYYKCTSLVRDVLNLYLYQLIEEGELEEARREHQLREWDIDCAAAVPEAISQAVAEYVTENIGSRKRQLTRDTQEQHAIPRKNNQEQRGFHRRRLMSSSSFGDDGSSSLSLQEMMGTFCLHYGMMLLAIVASLMSSHWSAKSRKKHQPESVSVGAHGPTTGKISLVEANSFRKSTCVSSAGIPNQVGNLNSLSINACVIPEGAPLDNREKNGREKFLDEDDSLNDTSREELTHPMSAIAHREGDILDSASFSRLQKHFDDKLQEATDQFEAKLEQHTSLIITLLQDMRGDDSQNQREGHGSGRYGEHDHRQDMNRLGQPTNAATMAGHLSGRHDFGHYLRQSKPTRKQSKAQTQKNHFGRYLLHQSEHDYEEP